MPPARPVTARWPGGAAEPPIRGGLPWNHRRMRAHRAPAGIVAVLATAALAATGTSLLAAGPADAVSGALTYSCTSSHDAATYAVGAVVDTNAPAGLVVQQSVSLVATATVTLPDALTAAMRSAGATSVSGSTQVAEVVDGTTRTLNQTVPSTPVPATGSLKVTSSGPGGTIRGVAAGTPVVITAGGVSVAVTGYDAAGAVRYAIVLLTCQLAPANQNALVDTVPVLPIPTTTSLEARVSPIPYGTSAKLVVKVTKAGTTAKPDGTVALTTNGETVSAAVENGKAVVSLPPARKMGATTVSAAFTPTDKNVAASTGTTTYAVVRAGTAITTLLTLRDTRHDLIGTSLVSSLTGTDVAGQVRFTLLKDGAKIRTATVRLTRLDRARAVFHRIRKPGTYLLKTTYLGSPSLKRSKTQVKLRINDPNA